MKWIIFLLMIFVISFVSADFPKVVLGEAQQTTVTIITNGTDTNETARFNTLTGTDCIGTNKVTGVADSGLLVCDADVGASETDPFWSANYTAYNSSWSSITNTSYYLATNPFGFFNTSNTKNCTAGQYAQNFTLNSSGIFPVCTAPTLSESDPLWSANYTLYNASWSSITNTSYYLATNPFGFFNTSNTFNCTSGQVVMNLTLNSTGAYGKCIAPTLSESDPYWSANYTLYNSSWSSITNTSYYLATNPFTFWNSTFATFNKTYADALYYTLNNPYGYFNTSYRYNCTSGQYVQNITSNSSGVYGMCSAPTLSESDPLWSANYTLYNLSWSSITNTSYYLVTNPFGFFNISNTYNCSNGQWVQNLTLNSSGAFGKCSAPTLSESDPLWTGNQTNYFNKTDILGFSYYNLTNFDINNYYLKSNPFTFWNSTFATFNKTYADTLYSTIAEPKWSANYTAYNSSWSSITNTSYLEKAGGTMTGNLTLTNAASRICNATASCPAYIHHNGTGWIIKG